MSKILFRCAIYTRKSTEEGLDQEFNSLDAQREACAAYIASQASLGWKAVSRHYDDGGISGGTMERPALQDLLDDITAGRVDVVVVYKIDRLTRSLMDFARIVEVFDRHEVSFVSVTQQFNTTTSMGRLTLNVLLSFAQFEREVTAERIRDKIAASRKKGMWMGGTVPIGYRSEDKRLVIEPGEAGIVRQLFRLYLEIGSVRRLKEKVDELGLRTPKRPLRKGKPGGDRPFSRGHLYWLLSNPLYVGDVRHGDKVWPGQHEAIIDREMWDAVQKGLSDQAPAIRQGARMGRKSLLAGLVFDETGDRLSPSHAVKDGRRYRYYISHRLMQARKRDEAGWRLPAEELEATILTALADLLRDQKRLMQAVGVQGRDPAAIRQAMDRSSELAASVTGQSSSCYDSVRLIVGKIVVAPQQLTLMLSHQGLCTALGIAIDGASQSADTVIHLPFTLRRRGVEARLVIGGTEQPTSRIDTRLVETIAQAHHWMTCLTAGDTSVIELAREAGLDDGEISRVLPLACLAPDIIEAILRGRQPVELTARHLKRLKPLPPSWQDQRKILGFAAVN
jgi:DNA invertase Pin-like site-specific DNA recombinase